MNLRTIILGIAFWAYTLTAFAAVPQMISYQGYLADSGSVAVSGPVSMTFRLYNVETGGTPLWEETQTVQMNNGIYAVALGAVADLAPAIIDGDLWLGVTVEADAEMTPRQKLQSVPFALKAASVSDASITDAKLSGTIDAGRIAEIAQLQATVTQLQQEIENLNSQPIVSINSPAVWHITSGVISLDGQASDADVGDAGNLSIQWSFDSLPAGSAAVFTDNTSLATAFAPDLLGSYVVRLTATDPKGASSVTTQTIQVQNSSPTTIITAPATWRIPSGALNLMGKASDVDAYDVGNLSIQWSFDSLPAGSLAVFADNTNLTTSFAPDVEGDYMIRLTATDYAGASGSATTTVHVLEGTTFTDNGDGTVTDNSTGLTWLKDAGCTNFFGRENYVEGWVTNLRTGVCGLVDGSSDGDWRLPTLQELQGVLDQRFTPRLSNSTGDGPWNEGDAFSNVILSHRYFTKTRSATTSKLLGVDLNDGSVIEDDGTSGYSWPVRVQ